MKNSILFPVLVMLMMSSCKPIQFESPQPKDAKAVSSFPADLTGVYLNREKDTLIITESAFKYGNENTSLFLTSGSLLSGDTVLKKFKEYYVINIKNGDYWEVIPFKYDNKKITTYYISIDEDKEEKVKELKEILPVTEIKNIDGETDKYLINPTAKEFETLLEKKVFLKAGNFKRIK